MYRKGQPQVNVPINKYPEIIAAYESGKSLSECAGIFGVTHGTIRLILIRSGVKRRPAVRDDATRRKYTVDDAFFSEIDTEAKAWALGLISADGCIHRKWNGIILRLHTSDVDAIEMLATAMHATSPIFHTQKKDKRFPGKIFNYSGMMWTSQRHKQDLARLGVGPNKTSALSPWQAPSDRPDLAAAYFRGLIDGDGWVEILPKTKANLAGTFSIGLCGTYEVCEGFRSFICQYIPCGTSVYPNGSIWSVGAVGYARVQPLARVLYGDATVFLRRKKAIADQIMAAPTLGEGAKNRSKWAHLTRADLEAMHREFGDWNAVSRHLGMRSSSSITKVRKRVGL